MSKFEKYKDDVARQRRAAENREVLALTRRDSSRGEGSTSREVQDQVERGESSPRIAPPKLERFGEPITGYPLLPSGPSGMKWLRDPEDPSKYKLSDKRCRILILADRYAVDWYGGVSINSVRFPAEFVTVFL